MINLHLNRHGMTDCTGFHPHICTTTTTASCRGAIPHFTVCSVWLWFAMGLYQTHRIAIPFVHTPYSQLQHLAYTINSYILILTENSNSKLLFNLPDYNKMETPYIKQSRKLDEYTITNRQWLLTPIFHIHFTSNKTQCNECMSKNIMEQSMSPPPTNTHHYSLAWS